MAKYVGKRIVPLHCGEWDQTREYEMLSVVLYKETGDSYMARRQVSAGTAITDTAFWAKSSDYSEQLYLSDVKMNDTLAAVKRDNDQTEAAIKADNDATEQAIKADNKAIKEDLTNKVDRAVAELHQGTTQMEQTSASLTARMNSIAGAATSDTEILDARVDANGDKHDNLGEAVRSIIPQVKERLFVKSTANLIPTDEFWEIGNIHPDTGEDCEGNSNARTIGYVPVTSAKSGTAYYGGDAAIHLIFVLFYSDEGFISRSTVLSDPEKGAKKEFTIPAGTTRLRFGVFCPSVYDLKMMIPKDLFIGLGTGYETFPDREVLNVSRLMDPGTVTEKMLADDVSEMVNAHIDTKSVQILSDAEAQTKVMLLTQGTVNLVPPDDDWEHGNISPSTGEDIDGSANCRTKSSIPINGAKELTIAFETETKFSMVFILFYSEDGFIDRYTPIDAGKSARSAVVAVPANAVRLRLCIFRSGITRMEDLIPHGLFLAYGRGYTSYPYREVLDVSHRLDSHSITKDKLADEVIEFVEKTAMDRCALDPSATNLFPVTEWEVGGINVEDGIENDNSSTIRALTNVPLKGDTLYSFADYSDELKYSIFFIYLYAEDGSYVRRESFSPVKDTVRTFTTAENVTYDRITIYGSATVRFGMIPEKPLLMEGKNTVGYVFPQVISPSMFDNSSIPEEKIKYNHEFVVPEYYENYIKQKTNRINELARATCASGDVFIFITDEHWTLNQMSSLALIKYLDKNANIPRLFSGGDVGNSISPDYCRKMRRAFSGRIYHTIGNHEYFSHVTGSDLYYDMDSFNEEQIGNPFRHYYYVDNRQQKIRYIVLNAFSEMTETSVGASPGYDDKQMEWLGNVALNVDEGWTILIFTHMFYNVGMANQKLSMTSYAQKALAVIDAYDGKGTIAAVIQGHTHRDRLTTTPGGVPVIITTCDKNGVWTASTGDKDILVDRSTGTIREQAFDVMILNKTERTITAVRIGCPAEGGTGDDPGVEVEERVIHY